MPDAPTAVTPTGLPSAPAAPAAVAVARRLETKNATLLTGTAIDGNVIRFTHRAQGFEGDEYSLEHVNSSAGTVETTATVTGTVITVNLGEQARLVISGTATPIDQPVVFYKEPVNGRNSWGPRADDVVDSLYTEVFYEAGQWVIAARPGRYEARKTSAASSPVGLTGWTVITGSGQPVITAGRSDARQVVTACNRDVSSIIFAENIGNDDGAVTAMAAAQFSGGYTALTINADPVIGAEPIDGMVDPDPPPAVQATGMPSAPSAPSAVQP